MVFGTPVTWFAAEVLWTILFLLCCAHAVATRPARPDRLFELIAFVVYAGIYENIGVWAHIYDYDLHRVLMFGRVPMGVLMLEAVIFYCGLRLTEYLRLPTWAGAIVVGLLGSVQDMTIDPANVFDTHRFGGGAPSGQWNWAMHYSGGFFGIPFFNFSGWLTMMVYFAAALALLRWAQGRGRLKWLGGRGGGVPFAAGLLALVVLVSPVNQFLLWASPFFSQGRWPELTMLIINLGVSLTLLIRYQRTGAALDLRRDGLIFAVPPILHLFDVVVAFTMGVSIAYMPVIVITVVHVGYLAVVARIGVRAAR